MHLKAFLPSTSDFTLKKSERLCSKKAFEFLFADGKTIFQFPLKIVLSYEKKEGQQCLQVAFGVNKRNFKRAVKRNRIKRLLREAYRKHKLPVFKDLNIYLMFIYVSKEIEKYELIEESLIKALNQIKIRIEKAV